MARLTSYLIEVHSLMMSADGLPEVELEVRSVGKRPMVASSIAQQNREIEGI